MRKLALFACVFVLGTPSTAEARGYSTPLTVTVPLNIKDVSPTLSVWVACGAYDGNPLSATFFSQAVRVPTSSAPGGLRFLGSVEATVHMPGAADGTPGAVFQSGNTIECRVLLARAGETPHVSSSSVNNDEFVDTPHSNLFVRFRLL